MFTTQELEKEFNGLRKFSYKLTRNIPDGEDLLHNTCLRALEKKHLFKEGSSLFKWASKIMYNIFVSEYRRKVKFETQYDPEPYLEKQSTRPTQDTTLAINHVHRAMKVLSLEHRQVIIMICVKGMRYRKVAQILDVPVGTVRSRLSRARSKLRDIMEHEVSFIQKDVSKSRVRKAVTPLAA